MPGLPAEALAKAGHPAPLWPAAASSPLALEGEGRVRVPLLLHPSPLMGEGRVRVFLAAQPDARWVAGRASSAWGQGWNCGSASVTRSRASRDAAAPVCVPNHVRVVGVGRLLR